jgi:lysophospholipase L1-like esterase
VSVRVRSVAAALLSFVVAGSAAAQAPDAARWEPEIRAFEAADAASPPRPGAVLFLGSSSIRLWATLAQDFPEVATLNRGFGGSQIPDATRYVPRIVLPYKPRLIVFYSGGNDINAGRTPEQVQADFAAFVAAVHAALPETRIAFISIAGNPARWAQVDRVKRANALVEAMAKADPRLAFIDVYSPMLGADGQPRPEIFVADRLHMNRDGYRIWARVVAPYLVPGAAGR